MYVPSGSIDAYQKATGWKEFTNILPLETPTGFVEYIRPSQVPVKYMRNGQIYILSNGELFDIYGTKIQ